jgi:hypothetical protein
VQDPTSDSQPEQQPEMVESQNTSSDPSIVESELTLEETPAISEEAAPPAEEVSAASEEVPSPEEEIAAVGEEATPPAEEVAAVSEETPPPEEEEEIAAVGEEAAPPAEEIAAVSEEALPPEEEIAAVGEEAAPPAEEIAVVSEEVPPPEEEALPEGPSFGEQFSATLAPIRERLSATFALIGERLGATLAPIRERLSPWARAYGVYALIGVLTLVILFLPPISLLERMGIVGYTTINAEDSSVSHPDGLTVSVNPETFTGKLRVRLDSVPREDFLGFAHSSLRDTVEALPDYFEVKSPFYKIQTRGKSDEPVMLDVVMPNDAEPWKTLDLYTWTGEAWEWVGSDLHTETAEEEFIRAQVTDIPANLVVVQAGPMTRTVSASLGPDDHLEAAADVLDEVNPTGLLLGTDGSFVGDPGSLLHPSEESLYAVLPSLRNWAPGASINRGLLSDVLTDPEIQETHVNEIVQLCTERGFAGVNVDYRGVNSDERDAYSGFISTLAEALHAEGLRLTVVVEPPTPTDDGWDTGGYDWTALGAVADAVKVPFPEDPTAYAEGGEAQRLLDWATAQVPRYKLCMLVSSLSTEQFSDKVSYVSLEQALSPFGRIVALGDMTHVEQSGQVEFGLAGTLLSIMPQEDAGTYRLEYTADDGQTHVIWLGTAANLAAKLQWAQRYHLGGIAVADMLAPGNAPGIAETVAAYRAATALPESQDVEVAWSVVTADALVDQKPSSLTDPGYTWTAMVATGAYTVNAKIAGFDHGSLVITVGEPEPVTVVTVREVTPTTTLTTEVSTGGTVDACLNASFVADVTIPDNTQLDNGEEFDKTWRVRNSGTCAWPEDAVLAFLNGSKMDAPDSVEVGTAEPGTEVDVTVKMKAPADPGLYAGNWQMKTAEGFFGTNLAVVIQAGEGVAAAAAPPPVVALASGGAFELGGHIRDGGYPYADQMHYAGMNWSKVQVHYPQDASGIIAAAHSRGFKIQVSALGSPNMVTQSGFEQNVANWVAGMAAAGADAIEVWNEPNIDREWAIGHISPQAYTNLLCTAYNAIKAANPNTAVISGAPSPTGWFGGCSPNGCDDLPFVQGMYNAGAANCMDYLGAHHNQGATAPSARSGHPHGMHHSYYFLPQTELYYNTFGGTRKLFYTELGYASEEGVPAFSEHFSFARGINNAQQAAWLAEAVQLSVNTGMVRCIIVWNIDYGRYGADPQDGYAIIRPGGSCPACDALHNVLGTR